MGMLCILEYRLCAKEVRCEFTLHFADISSKILLHALTTVRPIISFRNTFTFKEIVMILLLEAYGWRSCLELGACTDIDHICHRHFVQKLVQLTSLAIAG